jgi:hypothetical protein
LAVASRVARVWTRVRSRECICGGSKGIRRVWAAHTGETYGGGGAWGVGALCCAALCVCEGWVAEGLQRIRGGTGRRVQRARGPRLEPGDAMARQAARFNEADAQGGGLRLKRPG